MWTIVHNSGFPSKEPTWPFLKLSLEHILWTHQELFFTFFIFGPTFDCHGILSATEFVTEQWALTSTIWQGEMKTERKHKHEVQWYPPKEFWSYMYERLTLPSIFFPIALDKPQWYSVSMAWRPFDLFFLFSGSRVRRQVRYPSNASCLSGNSISDEAVWHPWFWQLSMCHHSLSFAKTLHCFCKRSALCHADQNISEHFLFVFPWELHISWRNLVPNLTIGKKTRGLKGVTNHPPDLFRVLLSAPWHNPVWCLHPKKEWRQILKYSWKKLPLPWRACTEANLKRLDRAMKFKMRRGRLDIQFAEKDPVSAGKLMFCPVHQFGRAVFVEYDQTMIPEVCAYRSRICLHWKKDPALMKKFRTNLWSWMSAGDSRSFHRKGDEMDRESMYTPLPL